VSSYALRRIAVGAAVTALLLAVLAVSHRGGRRPGPVGDGTAALTTTTPSAAATRVTPTSSPTSARPSARPTSTPTTSPASMHPTGSFLTVPGRSAVAGSGPLKRYRVQVERGLVSDEDEYAEDFAELVQRTLGDPRGWGHGGRMSFQRVASGRVAFTVVLASPRTTDRLCAPLRTGGIFSCYNSRGKSVINFMRWRDGARSYAGHLGVYRQYVISHEVGHALGHDHAYSCRPDGLAPTMMQQTKSLYGCKRNAWPYP
jgi:hypothetical protein